MKSVIVMSEVIEDNDLTLKVEVKLNNASELPKDLEQKIKKAFDKALLNILEEN